MRVTTIKRLNVLLVLKAATVLFAGLVIFLVSGCSTQRINMVEQGEVSVQLVETSPITVRGVSIVRDTKGVILSGYVTRQYNSKSPIRGHIDIDLIGPDDKVFYGDILRLRTRRVTVTRRVFRGEFTAK